MSFKFRSKHFTDKNDILTCIKGNPINSINYGEDVPNEINSPYYIQFADDVSYLLLNTELTVDSYLTAIEYYSIAGGYLGFAVSDETIFFNSTQSRFQ